MHFSTHLYINMIESIDEVRPGEYLMCAKGPLITGTDSRGRFASKHDRSFEGSVVRVLAVAPPIMLIKVFPMPCGDPTHDHSPYVTPTQFDYVGWTRVNRRYVREYMKAAHHTKPTPPPKQMKFLTQHVAGEGVVGVMSSEGFNKLLDDIYKSGSSPDVPFLDDDDDQGEDDGHYSPTD